MYGLGIQDLGLTLYEFTFRVLAGRFSGFEVSDAH